MFLDWRLVCHLWKVKNIIKYQHIQEPNSKGKKEQKVILSGTMFLMVKTSNSNTFLEVLH